MAVDWRACRLVGGWHLIRETAEDTPAARPGRIVAVVFRPDAAALAEAAPRLRRALVALRAGIAETREAIRDRGET